MLEFFNSGVMHLSFWGYVAVTFIFVQISMMSVTLYLHRDQAHRAIDLHPALRHFFRLWIWMTTGTVTRKWVAVHRKHHAMVEREGDPHSPQVFGLRKVLLQGYELYRIETEKEETLQKYGRGTPDDWPERIIYARFTWLGIFILLGIDIVLMGLAGITVFAVQMLAMPVCAAGIINGLGHAKGYRNYESDDTSTNLFPLAVLIGGEELHNNHHAFPTAAKFSARWWEFDIGWLYITLLKTVGLCKVRRLAPMPQITTTPRSVDIETVAAVLQNRMHVLRDYRRKVMLPVFRLEKRLDNKNQLLRRARKLFVTGPTLMDDAARERLALLLENNVALHTVHEFRQQLLALWEQANVSNERLVSHLREWCRRAEASGVDVLHDFSANLRGYLPQAA